MTTQSLRFLCAGGFHLHAVLEGIDEAPDALLDVLSTAPYRAAEQFFQAALREEVDFVVLTGDLLDAASGGPRAVAFLRKQFELLHDNGIPVYWAASRLDLSSDWLEHVKLPPTVHRFSDDGVQHDTIRLNDMPVAVVLGRSWNPQRPLRAAEFTAASELSQIAVLFAPCDADDLPAGIDLCVTGGSSSSHTETAGKQTVHAPGWLQGFHPAQTGPHGCTLVHIDAAGDVRTRRIETDVVRWAQERVIVPDGASLADIRNAFRLRAQKLLADAGRLVLAEWSLAGEGWFNSPMIYAPRRAELLEWLRDEFGKGSQAVWSLSLEVEPPERLRDEWTDEDSILGDYLRITREYWEEDTQPLGLDVPSTARQLPDELQDALPLTDPQLRRRALQEAAVLGIGLLRGEDRLAETMALSGRENES